MYLKRLKIEHPEEYKKKFGKYPDSDTLCKICAIEFGEHYDLCCPRDYEEQEAKPKCPSCKGSRLKTDPATGIVEDDVCPECDGE